MQRFLYRNTPVDCWIPHSVHRFQGLIEEGSAARSLEDFTSNYIISKYIFIVDKIKMCIK